MEYYGVWSVRVILLNIIILYSIQFYLQYSYYSFSLQFTSVVVIFVFFFCEYSWNCFEIKLKDNKVILVAIGTIISCGYVYLSISILAKIKTIFFVVVIFILIL